MQGIYKYFLILDQQNEVLHCNVPLSSKSAASSSKDKISKLSSFNLVRIFNVLNTRKNQKLIESYSLSQTTLEQIFVRLAGDDENIMSDTMSDTEQSNRDELEDQSMLFNNEL